MNGAHFHLLVNHLPIIFPIVGAIVMIVGLVFKSEAVKRVAYLIFVFAAIAAIAAMASGDEAEEIAEKISGVSENYIKIHEEAAEKFAVLTYLLGAISLVGLWASIKQKSFSMMISLGSLFFVVIVLFFSMKTGTTGGEIRHTEIRNGNITVPSTELKNTKKDDDD